VYSPSDARIGTLQKRKHTLDGWPTVVARGRAWSKTETASRVCFPFWGTLMSEGKYNAAAAPKSQEKAAPPHVEFLLVVRAVARRHQCRVKQKVARGERCFRRKFQHDLPSTVALAYRTIVPLTTVVFANRGRAPNDSRTISAILVTPMPGRRHGVSLHE
jgi:hypothetical protein